MFLANSSSCAEYLCPSYPSAAEQYILQGCETTQLVSSSPRVFGFVAFTALAALVVGFVVGAKQPRHGYLPVRTRLDYDDF